MNSTFSEAFSGGLILPAILLAAMGWIVPWLLGRVFPEGVKPLMLLAFVATLILACMGMAFFLLLYASQGIPLASITEAGIGATVLHFGRLGLISALIWGPLMLLSIANLPRHWTKATW